MDELPGRAVSLWRDTAKAPSYPPLMSDITCDVAVIGGGIVGVTAAYVLKKAGLKVCLIENRTLGSGTTGRTTAKVSSLHSLIYQEIASSFGNERAELYGCANQSALEWICAAIAQNDIDCDFSRLPAFTFTAEEGMVAAVEKEARLAKKLGLPASFATDIGLAVPVKGAVRFEDQAQFHPLKYLFGLAADIPGDGSAIYENTRALDVDEGRPAKVTTNRGKIMADHVILATHLPFLMGGLYFARTSPESHPAVAYRTLGPALPGMYLSVKGHPHSVRTACVGDTNYLISNTPGYKTGHADSVRVLLGGLIEECRQTFPVTTVDYHWEAHDYMPADGIPYVGRLTNTAKNVYVATGFRAWGMTNGTAAALMLADLILGHPPEWMPVFDSTRKDLEQLGKMVSRTIDSTKHLIVPRLLRSHEKVQDIAPGRSKVAEFQGEQIAVARQISGELHAVSPSCGHLGCFVSWNDAELTWDCPCHGSRYAADGAMLEGPTIKDLRAVALVEQAAESPAPGGERGRIGTEPALEVDASQASKPWPEGKSNGH